MDTQALEATRGREMAGMTSTPTTGEPDNATSVFVHARPGLLKIAKRVVGDTGEAEDVIQETWIRWQGTDRAVVLNPAALLSTTTVRLAINVVRSAWKRRESCAGPWFPEPTDTGASPEAVAETLEAVERAVLLLMEALTPTQRAAYVLRVGFAYPYTRISGILRLSVANARQQVSRAQKRLATDHSRQPVDSVAYRRLVQAFLAAAQSGDLAHLERVLSTDIGHPPNHR